MGPKSLVGFVPGAVTCNKTSWFQQFLRLCCSRSRKTMHTPKSFWPESRSNPGRKCRCRNNHCDFIYQHIPASQEILGHLPASSSESKGNQLAPYPLGPNLRYISELRLSHLKRAVKTQITLGIQQPEIPEKELNQLTLNLKPYRPCTAPVADPRSTGADPAGAALRDQLQA